MDNFFSAFFSGALVAAIIFAAASHLTRINISDAELYRFCMQHEIKLADCKISRELLDKGTNQ